RQAALADPDPVDPATVEEWLSRIRSETPGQSGCIALGADDEVRRDLEARLKVDRLLEKVTAKTAKPASKDIAEHYRKNREAFLTPEVVHAAHIVKNVDENCDEASARAAIEEAERELAAGADFAELADRLSDCPGRGGDLGFFPRGEMVDEFEAHAFSLPIGQLSPIFRSPFGFHILKVYARRPEGVRELSEVRSQIEEQLWQEKKQKTVEQFLDRLWAQAKIEDQP
ncbi:MAG: peptidyl-prolyl cis-trans isomerase, partial [Bryobacteraceae bacterium]|nr:peptidyl-prolyl cis-trans isomerase [Bryobacteraceae bacterium]